MLLESRSKLICTIGPASSDIETIKAMILNGMNVARLNFSHGTHASHKELIDKIRKASSDLGKYVGILQDLCGPKIRLGNLPDEGIKLRSGEIAILTESSQSMADTIPVDYEGLHNEVKVGESILISDGMIDLLVESIDGVKVICKIINGGVVFTKKGVNLPQSKLRIPAFSVKDREDLEFGLKEKLDFVALSFVRNAEDLNEIRYIIEQSDFHPRLIAKIEKPQAIENLSEIMKVVDGVMVARGDLGVEMPLEQIPHMQKEIIRKARECGVIVITATQMLQSMVSSPRPTRSETTDVANAVLDGTDALMLSDETASGNYPVEAINTLSKIARSAESYSGSSLNLNIDSMDEARRSVWGVGRAASWLAKDIGAKVIVLVTVTGYAAYSVARFRPEATILALSPTLESCRRMSIIWGIDAILVDNFIDKNDMIRVAISKVKETGLATTGDKIIITAGLPLGTYAPVNFLQIIDVD